MRRYNTQTKGQKDTPNDAEDNWEEMDYFAEMEGLNKLGDSPLKVAFTNVMNQPKTSPKESNTKGDKSTPVTNTQVPEANPEIPNLEDESQDKEKIDTPSAKQGNEQKCLNLIFNTKNKDEVSDMQIQTAGEIFSNFFNKDIDFKIDEDCKYNIDSASIFPTVTRDNLTDPQQSTFDKILNHMRISWSKKYGIKIKTSNPKKKHTRTKDEIKTSPLHQKAKVENPEQFLPKWIIPQA